MVEKFKSAGARLVNGRLERQRGEQIEYHEIKSAAGQASVKARREQYGTAQPNTGRTSAEQPVQVSVWDAVRTAPNLHRLLHLQSERPRARQRSLTALGTPA